MRVTAGEGGSHRYGGQAVVDGVMMRGERAMAVAVRLPSGAVLVHDEPLQGLFYRRRWARLPFLRGVFLLWSGLTLGMRTLVFSVNVALAEQRSGVDSAVGGAGAGDATGTERGGLADQVAKETFGGGMMWGTLAVSLTLTIGLFFAVPVLAAEAAVPVMPAGMSTGWLEAAIRLGLFLTYLWLIGYVPGVRRVFAYHGAEHKAINAYEAGEPLELERVLPYSTAHPRCGTTFVLYVVVVSALVFALLGSPALPLRVASRVVLVPVVASLAYEVTRLAGRWRYQPAARTLLAPGLALQALTTREPGAPEVEVALEALRRVLLREESHVTPP